ncbi:MAG TPA: M1 family metallopeptidase [Thermoanaerobaculia bacterium]|nr:M1 family metallopeptidase [Thermoanaerobaculia bacterium]
MQRSSPIAAPALALLVMASACAHQQAPPATVPAQQATAAAPLRLDVHSFARPEEAVVRNIDLDLTVDFDRKELRGRAVLQIENRLPSRLLYLDTRDLTISRITLGEEEKATSFFLGDPTHLGHMLAITIEPATTRVNIDYATSPEAAAVQWLSPEQTAGKKRPFLFTQSQAILARTWIPLQDTPAVRTTYSATIRAPSDLLAIMSAENPTEKNATGIYHFRMPQPVPSYLFALAVGDLEFRPLGPTSGVYAEPEVIERAAWELADTPRMIDAAASLYGPYRWGRYDVLVLPPSFPFGGMENPRLTFATPTILAGDRSLVALVAHELAHSWSGNLVTNATWSDFWLNEGFTVYFERRIMESVFGREYTEMLAALGLQDLRDEVARLGPHNPDTALHLNLLGRDPDDGVTEVAYEKGYSLLRMIEERMGRDRFDPFLRRYFDTFAFRSMDTESFLAHMKQNLFGGDTSVWSELRIDEWVYGPGLPANVPQVQSARFAAVDRQVAAVVAGARAEALETENWTTHEWLHFIRNLPRGIGADRMAELDRRFRLTDSGNSEILSEWLLLGIANEYAPAYPALESFLTRMGRRKFLRPLYLELAKSEKGMEFARRVYAKARPTYHAVSQQTIDAIVK